MSDRVKSREGCARRCGRCARSIEEYLGLVEGHRIRWVKGRGAVLRVGTCSMKYRPQLKFFLQGPVVRKCCRGKVEWRWWESGGSLNWGWALARWVTTPEGE